MSVRRVVLTGLLLLAADLPAAVLNYQGRLQVDGAYYTGTGHFKFALVDPTGALRWASGDIALTVSDGRYAVRLGDSPRAPRIADALVRPPSGGRLRIWFQRAGGEWALAGDDVAVVTNPPAAIPAQAAPASTAEIVAELRAIRVLLTQQLQRPRGTPAPAAPTPQTVTVSIAGSPSLGNRNAPAVLVEFTDFQCPYCIKFHNDVFQRLKAAYVDTGKLRVVSRSMPLPFHPLAEPAARAVMCAEAQGQFWPMHEKLFGADGKLEPASLTGLARGLGLDAAKFQACLAAPEIAAAVARQAQQAHAVGIDATPTFVLGRATGDRVTGVEIIGAQPFENFAAAIQTLLGRKT